eukprot:IDg18048t1
MRWPSQCVYCPRMLSKATSGLRLNDSVPVRRWLQTGVVPGAQGGGSRTRLLWYKSYTLHAPLSAIICAALSALYLPMYLAPP